MVKKGNLYTLIKSLSKAEKRYFKLFCSTGKTNSNYLRLFNAIDKQVEYSEKEIRRVFKGESFISQLHVTKIYLTELILKSLRNYNNKNSVTAQLLDLIRDIEILFNKALYDLCLNKIQKAEKLAAEFEKLPFFLEILSWKRKLLLVKLPPRSPIINNVISFEKDAINKLNNLNSYWNYTVNFFEFTNDPKFIRNTFFKNPDNANTLQAKILYMHTLYVYNVVKGNIKKAEEYVTKLITLLEDNPERIKDDPHSYVTAISNKIGLLLNNQEMDEIPALIEKMREAPVKYGIIKHSQDKYTLRLQLRMFNVELEVYRDTRELIKGNELIQRILLYLAKFKKSVPEDYLILFYYQFAYICFLRKDFSESLKWLNEIINYNFGDTREDIQVYARILNLVIHFELKNIIVLRYSVDGCRRFLQKKKKLQQLNKIVLKLFSQLSTSLPEKYSLHLNKAYDELFSGEKPIMGAQSLDYIDLKGWIEGKIKM